MKNVVLLIAVAAALIAATSSTGAEVPIIAKAVGFGTIKTPVSLKVKPGAMAVEAITVNPGGSFGWHTHGAPVAVVVTSGTLTVFDPSVANCSAFKVSKGQAFIEPANHVHLARNDTARPATLYATFLVIPKGIQSNKPAKQPAGCNA
jgi:quercetin dioxygenase-like cupin family protein